MRDGIPDLNLTARLDTRDDIADVPRRDLLAWLHVEAQYADFISVILLARSDELHVVSLTDLTIHHLEVSDDTAEGVEDRVKDQALQRSFGIALRSRDTLDDRTEDVIDPQARLTAGPDDLLTLAAKELDDLILDLFGHSAWQVDLIDDRYDLEVMLESHIEIGNRLCLNTLSCVDDKQCAFAGSDGAGDFVGEVHVSWGINQIEYVVLAIELVVHLDGVALNGDPALALEIHIIEYLLLKILPRDGLCRLQQAVSQGTLPMVNMGYNAKVTYMLHLDYKDTTKTGK